MNSKAFLLSFGYIYFLSNLDSEKIANPLYVLKCLSQNESFKNISFFKKMYGLGVAARVVLERCGGLF